ncbi:hypothetical protein EMIT079MI2_230065 [Bacillus sp. IT-79MI2]
MKRLVQTYGLITLVQRLEYERLCYKYPRQITISKKCISMT